MTISRRNVLFALGALQAVPRLVAGRGTVKIVEFDSSGRRVGVSEVEKIGKTDAEWREELTPEQLGVAPRQRNQRALTRKYASNHVGGIYRCIFCATAPF